ncbi:hypothetical protein OV090_11770 [Nannocystis sp. RBIL2]|uniref:DUF6882 domain-containing protein n=1 Tax=Nannocystis sp. RBIL2 TaxID=2996788 RepID=UPI002270C858|nr:DUF6882 domain-containing protein [Nannocystis sp. RBIL2]MCY1065446.1 hypothetical protein [Nannocystis sp. RBIL2]
MLAIERLFCDELFRIHRRQARFLDGLQATSYTFHKETGVLAFADGITFETQILGLETPAKQWMWAWADAGSLDSRLTTGARRVKAFGDTRGLAELTTGTLAVDHLRCAGHTLAAIASVVHEVHPYFRCQQPDGVALFVLVTSATLKDDARGLDRNTARQAISDMFAAYAQADDMLTLRAAMEAAGFAVEFTETEVIGRRGDDAPMVFQRAWFD